MKLNPDTQKPPFLPNTPIVQASGGTYCPETDPSEGFQGTLGVRVSQSCEVSYTFISCSHNFPDNRTAFWWMYDPGSGVAVGPKGRVIARKDQAALTTFPLPVKGDPENALPLLDCALIALDSTSPKDLTSGLWQGIGQPKRAVRGAGIATPGALVSMFGVMGGLTYGLVLPIFTNVDPVYDSYLFFIQLCNQYGVPTCGEFGQGGDSGSMVIDKNGYILGMFIGQVKASDTNWVGVATRFAQIEAALDVKLSPDA